MEDDSKNIKTIEEMFPGHCEIIREELPDLYEFIKDSPYIEPRPEVAKKILQNCLEENERLKTLELEEKRKRKI